jgi:hypothetical protein
VPVSAFHFVTFAFLLDSVAVELQKYKGDVVDDDE